jgi:hypothetical protein
VSMVDVSPGRGLLLEKEGWLQSWDAPVAHGGRIRYVHPTPKALRWALGSLAARTKAEPWAPLVRLMLPRSGRKPLTLGDGTIPKWLPHQREVNHLVASIATSPGRRVLWASSWDCPFPTRAGMFTLPQPDYVLVEEREGVHSIRHHLLRVKALTRPGESSLIPQR